MPKGLRGLGGLVCLRLFLSSFVLNSVRIFQLIGNEGCEYWFPRPHPSPSTWPEEKHEHRRPLIILGGGREALRERGNGMYETDDTVLDPEASERLRKFLPTVFPEKFGTEDNVEIEWVSNIMVFYQCEIAYDEVQTGIMGFTKSGGPFVSRPLDLEEYCSRL